MKPKRYTGRGDLHFITFSCYQRRPLLGTVRARNLFLKMLDEVRAKHDFLLLGYVVMPEHVHLLISESKQLTPSQVLQVLKQRVSRKMRGKHRRFRRNNCLSSSLKKRESFGDSGNAGSTISTFTQSRKCERNWITCTRIP